MLPNSFAVSFVCQLCDRRNELCPTGISQLHAKILLSGIFLIIRIV